MVVDVTESLPVVSIRSGILTAALNLSGFIQLLCDLSAGTGISAAAFNNDISERGVKVSRDPFLYSIAFSVFFMAFYPPGRLVFILHFDKI